MLRKIVWDYPVIYIPKTNTRKSLDMQIRRQFWKISTNGYACLIKRNNGLN